jgi:hypothetical protein
MYLLTQAATRPHGFALTFSDFARQYQCNHNRGHYAPLHRRHFDRLRSLRRFLDRPRNQRIPQAQSPSPQSRSA